jgi:hypothetical protein
VLSANSITFVSTSIVASRAATRCAVGFIAPPSAYRGDGNRNICGRLDTAQRGGKLSAENIEAAEDAERNISWRFLCVLCGLCATIFS